MGYDFKYSYDEFKKWEDSAEGMTVLQADWNNIRATCPDPVTYAVKDGKRLKLFFMFPATMDENRKYPLIIHVRGSGWEEQNMTGHYGDFADIVKSGIAVAFVQYRNANIAKCPAQIIDLKSAARYIYQHREEYPIDINNVFISGDSSGGHTAVLGYLTWDEEYLDDEDEKGALPKVRGLIDFYGVTDVKALCNTETGMAQEDNAKLGEGILEKEDDEHFAEVNAFCYVDLKEELGPVVIFHGNKDRLVPLKQSTDLYKALKARGTDVKLYMVNEADHGGPLLWNDEISGLVIDFVKKNCR